MQREHARLTPRLRARFALTRSPHGLTHGIASVVDTANVGTDEARAAIRRNAIVEPALGRELARARTGRGAVNPQENTRREFSQ